MIRFPNGLNGKRMTTDPTSRYSRILAYVATHPGATKREIAANAIASPCCSPFYSNRYTRGNSKRGVHVYVFRYMILTNALRMERDGKTFRYYIPEAK